MKKILSRSTVLINRTRKSLRILVLLTVNRFVLLGISMVSELSLESESLK